MSHEVYENPLIGRYASKEMSALWSAERKFRTWRRLWVMLAEAEAELGLDISPQQVEELRAHVDDIDFAPPSIALPMIDHLVRELISTLE